MKERKGKRLSDRRKSDPTPKSSPMEKNKKRKTDGTRGSRDRKGEGGSFLYGGPARSWPTFVKEVVAAPAEELLKEYWDLNEGKLPKGETRGSSGNPELCRYPDIPCLDDRRVHLQPDRFIHANFVNGFAQKDEYIVTQGPMSNTVEDFWEMVWQERTCLILMLCALKENKREKCAAYWPHEADKKMRAGGLKLHWLSTKTLPFGTHQEHLVRTEIALAREDTDTVRYVLHLHFTAWPDHGIPAHPSTAMDLCREVHVQKELVAEKNRRVDADFCPKLSPIVVHCSAGVGRSAVWVAIDIARRALRTRGKIEVPVVVKKIRAQRWGAVQKRMQYLYIYVSILSYLQEKKALEDLHVKDMLKSYIEYCEKTT